MDDLPLALPLHVPLDRAAHDPHARQVHRQYLVEILERVLGVIEVVVQRRVVHEHVDPAELADDGIGQRGCAGLVGHVDLDRDGAGTDGRAFGRHGSGRVRAHVGDDHLCALAREAQRISPSDALRGARDDGHPIPQSHGRAA